MPKSSRDGGPSFAGFVDTSSDDTAAPDWTPAPEVAPTAVDEPEPAPAEPRGRHRKITRGRGGRQT